MPQASDALLAELGLQRADHAVHEWGDEPDRRPLPRSGSRSYLDKNFIGRVESSFDFLGYHLAAGAAPACAGEGGAFLERVAGLYEWERAGRRPRGVPGAHVHRWLL
jgi:hypothetical protein